MDWKFAQPNIDWGSIVMFGAGIGLGAVLLKTKAATWLAQVFVNAFSLETASVFILIAVMAAFLIVIHLGFASATALSSAMIPIVISIVMSHSAEGLNPLGVTMLMQYAICFGLVLPVNSPQGMLAYGTDTFDVKTFMTTGIPIDYHWLPYDARIRSHILALDRDCLKLTSQNLKSKKFQDPTDFY